MSKAAPKLNETDTLRRSQIADTIVSGQAQSVRQQDQIRTISDENDQLKKEMAAISGERYDYVKADKLATLQSEVDAIERRYQFEKMRKNDLTKRYQLARIDLLHSRKARGGVNVEKEQSEAVQRQVDILENRLDQALGKFNDALSYNKELRDQIDIIREERRVFQRVHKKMEDDLKRKKRLMADLIEQSNRDMDERDEYVRQCDQVQGTIDQQQQEYRDQLRDIDLAMNEVKTMREDQNNLLLEIEAREYDFEAQLQDAVENGATNPSGMAGANSTGGSGMGFDATNTSRRGFGADGSDSEAGVTSDRDLAAVNEVVAQIRDALGEDDLEALRAEFVRLGENNFSLYKYINERTSVKESLADDIRDLHTLLEEENASESQQRRLILELEAQLASTEQNLDSIKDMVDVLQRAMNQVTSATEDVYTHIGCPAMLSNPNSRDARCSEQNLTTFLGTIEERAIHILCALQRRQRREELLTLAGEADSAAITPDEHESGELTGDVSAEDTTRDGSLAARADRPPQLLESYQAAQYEVAPLLPMAPASAAHTVSAQRLVKLSELPSASLGANDNTNTSVFGLTGDSDDAVVSHEELRRQMEMRLHAKRDREERAQRKKDAQSTSPRKAGAPRAA